MRTILFRAKDIIKNKWYIGYYRAYSQNFQELKHYICKGTAQYQIDPNTLGQYIGLKDKHENMIFENDIAKVLADRHPRYNYSSQSKYDLQQIETRSIITFKDFRWVLDIDTEYNQNILKLQGKEKDERTLSIRRELSDYQSFQKDYINSSWNREHNSHAYWCDIEIIGNIYDNKELLMPTLQ